MLFSKPHRLWYTRPLLKWDDQTALFCEATNMTSGTSILINDPVTLSSITYHCRLAQELRCTSSGLISKVDNGTLSPMIYVRELSIHGSDRAAVYLLDRQLLPNLRIVRSDCSCLFLALMRMSTTFTGGAVHQLDHIEQLVLIEKDDSFSLKRWCTILDGFPRLRSLRLSFRCKQCPPKQLVDVLMDYLPPKATNASVALSVDIAMSCDGYDKALLMLYLTESVKLRRHVGCSIWSTKNMFSACF